jgi:hypothetical protein
MPSVLPSTRIETAIAFDAKTMDVFWLIGFAGWKAIECYSPLVVYSAAAGQTISDLIKADTGLDDVERAYKERRATPQAFIEAGNVESPPWPPDLPRPSADRHALDDDQYINQSINNPTFKRRIEEKASERRSGFSLEFFASCASTKRPWF